MAEGGNDGRKPGSEDAAGSLRLIFERAWPLDRKPVFGGLVRAIDKFDRRQSRRRKLGNAADKG